MGHNDHAALERVQRGLAVLPRLHVQGGLEVLARLHVEVVDLLVERRQ